MWSPIVAFLVSPIVWSFSQRNSSLVRNYPTRKRWLSHSAKYSFSTGDTLNFELNSRDVSKPVWDISATLSGSTPTEPTTRHSAKPYPIEDRFIQNGEDTVMSGSSGQIFVDGKLIQYEWKAFSKIPGQKLMNPVVNVHIKGATVQYNEEKNLIQYKSLSSTSVKITDRGCPEGFTANVKENRCEDVDECLLHKYCHYNQLCKNVVGSYSCDCPASLHWNPDEKLCQDASFDRAPNKSKHNFLKAPAWVHECQPGFELVGDTCQDIDECLRGSPCGLAEFCKNTQGSYECSAPPCLDPAAEQLRDGTCRLWCNGTSHCEHGARTSESQKTITVRRSKLKCCGELARLEVPDVDSALRKEYRISSNHRDLEFRVRRLSEFDYVYTVSELPTPKDLTVTVLMLAYDSERNLVTTSEFIIHIQGGPFTRRPRRPSRRADLF